MWQFESINHECRIRNGHVLTVLYNPSIANRQWMNDQPIINSHLSKRSLVNVYMSKHRSMSLLPYHCVSEVKKAPYILNGMHSATVQYVIVCHVFCWFQCVPFKETYLSFFFSQMFNCVWGLRLNGFLWAIPITTEHKDIWFSVYNVVK